MNKGNQLKEEKKQLETELESLNASFHVSSFTNKQTRKMRKAVAKGWDQALSWYSELQKEMVSAKQAMRRDPDMRRFLTSIDNGKRAIASFFATHVQPIREDACVV